MNSSSTTTDPTLPPCEHRPRPYDGPSKAEVLDLRQTYLTPALLTMYRDPIMIVEGHMQYVFDEGGRRFLDAFGGIVTVSIGHCHPKVVEAVREQNERLQHTTTIYLHPNVAQFAKKLAGTFPAGSNLDVVYFCNSGSEANEVAILMARAFTGNFDIIALRNAYHGGSLAAMALTAHSTWKFNVAHSFGVHHAVLPDRYQGPFGYDDPDASEKYAADLLDLIQRGSSGHIAAFIGEPIQGVGGVIEMPPGYLEQVYAHIRAAGGVCIADEVQTGFGRTGDRFWGFENHGVTPDIVTMAKGIGNGCPLSACVTRSDIAKSLTAAIHFNTFGGNPVSTAQGMATLDVLLDENIKARARTLGRRLMDGLAEVQQLRPLIGDVRGRGLMVGVELVTDRTTKQPAAAETVDVLERCKDLGLLLGKGGFFGNVIRITPPMCLDEADVDFIVEVLDRAIRDTAAAAS
jgi:alanine-glyoxylate transaminase/(R)-3-amino-2-methylpropionate-pyruvate transaminase